MGKNVVVVGGGLAGLAASIYLARGGRTVTLFDKRRALGGRAITNLRQGYRFNLGAHAFYRGGAGASVYRELGIPVRGQVPKPKAIAVLGGEEYRLPTNWLSFLTTSLLSLRGKRQLGSALFHITIGEKDAWGQGYGTESTRLMLDLAFGALGLHRIALFVFEFNERAIRAYRRCGFVVEGRSRESIWRDGKWWDELAMSVLESDWQRLRASDAETTTERDQLAAEAPDDDAGGLPSTGAGTSAPGGTSASTGLLRRTMRRLR